MAAIPRASLLDEVYEFLLSRPTPEEILAYRPSQSLQARASTLLDHKKQGIITPEEDDELEAFGRANNFFSILKAKARLKLNTDEQHTHS